MTVTFAFGVMQLVCIRSYGLDAIGTVMRCIRSKGGNVYEVEYALNSEIKQREFYEEQLEAA